MGYEHVLTLTGTITRRLLVDLVRFYGTPEAALHAALRLTCELFDAACDGMTEVLCCDDRQNRVFFMERLPYSVMSRDESACVTIPSHCEDLAARLVEAYPDDLDAAVADGIETLASFLERREQGFPHLVVCNPEREIFRRFQLKSLLPET